MNLLWFLDGPLEGTTKEAGQGRPARELEWHQGGYWTYRLVGTRPTLGGEWTACFYSAADPGTFETAAYLVTLREGVQQQCGQPSDRLPALPPALRPCAPGLGLLPSEWPPGPLCGLARGGDAERSAEAVSLEKNYFRVLIGGPFDGARIPTNDRQPAVVVLDSEETSHAYRRAETRVPDSRTIEIVFRYEPNATPKPS